jgi:3-hydroxyacyl-[acyl-carrier-protein] dehydratase
MAKTTVAPRFDLQAAASRCRDECVASSGVTGSGHYKLSLGGRGARPPAFDAGEVIQGLKGMNEVIRSGTEVPDTHGALDTIDIAGILKAIPHRYPFLMVDRIVSIQGDDFAIGIKNVTANEPQFQGHFPDNPVFPGVLLIEGMAQTAGVICMHAMGRTGAGAAPYFLTIDKAKFRKPVYPGDTVEYHMTKSARRKNMWWYRGEAKVGGKVVAEAEVGAIINTL